MCNLYVGNVIVDVDWTKEVCHYHQAKVLFQAVGMNLCQFLSNDNKFNRIISNDDNNR